MLLNTLPTLDDGSGSQWNQRNRYAADLRFALDLYGSCTVDNSLIYLNVTETSNLCTDMSRDMFGSTRGRWWPPDYDYDQPSNASVPFADPPDRYAAQVKRAIKLTDVSTITFATLNAGDAGRLPLPIHYVEVNGEPLVPSKIGELPVGKPIPAVLVRGNLKSFQGNRPESIGDAWDHYYRTGDIRVATLNPLRVSDTEASPCSGTSGYVLDVADPTSRNGRFDAEDNLNVRRQPIYLTMCSSHLIASGQLLELEAWEATSRGILGSDGYPVYWQRVANDETSLLTDYESFRADVITATLSGNSPHSNPGVGTYSVVSPWHAFTLNVTGDHEVDLVANPGDDTPSVEIATASNPGYYCPAEADDRSANNREDEDVIRLRLCRAESGIVELRHDATQAVLNSYTLKPASATAPAPVPTATPTPTPTPTPVPTGLTAPTNVQATVSGSAVTVTWTPGQNAASHAVMVFTSDFTSTPHTDWNPGPGSTTIQNVAAGSYVVAVVAIDVNGDILYNLATVTVS